MTRFHAPLFQVRWLCSGSQTVSAAPPSPEPWIGASPSRTSPVWRVVGGPDNGEDVDVGSIVPW